MRENRTYGSEGGEPVMDYSPTPIYLSSVPDLIVIITFIHAKFYALVRFDT